MKKTYNIGMFRVCFFLVIFFVVSFLPACGASDKKTSNDKEENAEEELKDDLFDDMSIKDQDAADEVREQLDGEHAPEEDLIVWDLNQYTYVQTLANFTNVLGYKFTAVTIDKMKLNQNESAEYGLVAVMSTSICDITFNVDIEYAFYDVGGWLLESVNEQITNLVYTPTSGVPEDRVEGRTIIEHTTDLLNCEDTIISTVTYESILGTISNTISQSYYFLEGEWYPYEWFEYVEQPTISPVSKDYVVIKYDSYNQTNMLLINMDDCILDLGQLCALEDVSYFECNKNSGYFDLASVEDMSDSAIPCVIDENGVITIGPISFETIYDKITDEYISIYPSANNDDAYVIFNDSIYWSLDSLYENNIPSELDAFVNDFFSSGYVATIPAGIIDQNSYQDYALFIPSKMTNENIYYYDAASGNTHLMFSIVSIDRWNVVIQYYEHSLGQWGKDFYYGKETRTISFSNKTDEYVEFEFWGETYRMHDDYLEKKISRTVGQPYYSEVSPTDVNDVWWFERAVAEDN